MKKLTKLILSGFVVLGLVGCASNQTVSKSVSTAEAEETAISEEDNTLVVYFSGYGNTERVANVIAKTLDADVFELVPEEPYTEDDMEWRNEGSRVNLEHEDTSLQDIPLVQDTVDNWDEYSTVFIGYPIWWGNAAWPVNRFLKNNDFSNKTVIPFTTSASSPIGESAQLLEEMAGSGDWQEGQRFASIVEDDEVISWVEGLNLE